MGESERSGQFDTPGSDWLLSLGLATANVGFCR